MADIRIRVEKASREELETKQESKLGAEQKEKLAVASMFANQAIKTAKQITNYAVSNIGNFTGNYTMQDQVQNGVEFVSELATIGTAFAVSRVAGIIAVAGLGIKYTLQSISETKANRKTQSEIEYIRARAGASTTNGSRTGV